MSQRIGSVCFFVALFVSSAYAAPPAAAADGMLVLRLQQEKVAADVAGGPTTQLSGEAVYRIVRKARATSFELSSLSLIGPSVKTSKGDSGPLSYALRPGTAKTNYDAQKNVVTCEFLADLHYPLIDKLKGFIAPKEGEREQDDYRSHTETVSVRLTFALKEAPVTTRERKLRGGADVELHITPAETGDVTMREIPRLAAEFQLKDVTIYPLFNIVRRLNVQPVFVRYTPATGCFGGSTTATTGGSFPTLRDKAIEMWNRCCIRLNVLPPVYVANDTYRILSSAEEVNLLAEYDDPNAVEVFFVEVGDPVGIHGGGVSYSSGTANAKIITYDANLPINLYNLAHELGHSLGLFHPPGNSTPGSLMEPSGFCADNPALMSAQNCNNASNPLTHVLPLTLCTRHTNMP